MRKLGYEIETKALHYLQARGFSLIVRNFHCRRGEIDLIGFHHKVLVFVEVRYRKDKGFGLAKESITTDKQRKIKICAQYFFIRNPRFSNLSCRFDVVAVTLKQDISQLEWIQNAF